MSAQSSNDSESRRIRAEEVHAVGRALLFLKSPNGEDVELAKARPVPKLVSVARCQAGVPASCMLYAYSRASTLPDLLFQLRTTNCGSLGPGAQIANLAARAPLAELGVSISATTAVPRHVSAGRHAAW